MNMAATAGMSPEVKLSRPKLQMGWVDWINWGQINIVLLGLRIHTLPKQLAFTFIKTWELKFTCYLHL
jgi:hypothetical protein